MNKNDKYFVKLNEYLDGELTGTEREEFEKVLAINADLRKRLAELQGVKRELKKVYPELPEAPYLETRLFASLNEPKSLWHRIGKYKPIIAISLVTISLMAVLKYNPQILQEIVEKQGSHIAGFYKQNLKPLLYAANLTNEDIFNFAFYHQLPLDKNNSQYLHLGYDPKGNEFFEIKSHSATPQESSLGNFVKALDLNTSQKQKVDSILQSYADELQSQVLVNEENTVAINPNIWNYNKALLADLLSFAELSNKKEFTKIVPQGVNFADNAEVVKIIRQVKSSKPDQYIFFTPDSIFSESYSFDKKQYAEEMQQMKKELKNADEELHKITINIDFNNKKLPHVPHGNKFFVKIDSSTYRVNVPVNVVPDIDLPDIEQMAEQIDKASRNFRAFTFEVAPKGKNGFNFKYKDENGNPLDIKIDIDSLVANPRVFIQPPQGSMDRNKTIYLDSLFSSMRNFMPDSMNAFQQQEFRKQMKELEKEMRRFREEMMDMKKQFKEPKQQKQSETLEI